MPVHSVSIGKDFRGSRAFAPRAQIILTILFCLFLFTNVPVNAQTLIHPDQVEDVYLFNTGDVSTGDILAPTSEISAATLSAKALRIGDIPSDAPVLPATGAVIGGPLVVYGATDSLSGVIIGTTDECFRLYYDGDHVRLVSYRDIYIDPTDSGRVSAYIVPMATMQFEDVLGDKIQFYSHSYAIAVSPFDLDIRSDMNIKFHSDTVEDLFQILGDDGDVIAKRHITAGGEIYATTSFRFVDQQPGDKIYLYYPMYKLSISPSDLDFYSDQYFKFHSDTNEDSMILDADTGTLTTQGELGIRTADPRAALDVHGNANFSDSSTQSGQDALFVVNDASVSGEGNYGPSIGFSFLGAASIQRRAAIAAVQGTADIDQIGLAFFTHPSEYTAQPIIEAMRIDYSGNVGFATSTPTVLGEFNGDVAADSFITLSISSVKERIEEATQPDIEAAVQRVRSARLRTFYRKIRRPELSFFSDIIENGVTVRSATDQWLEAMIEWDRKKSHPKYARRSIGLVADWPGTPEAWIGYDDKGNVKGIIASRVISDLLITQQYILDRVDALDARINALEAKSR